MEVAGAARRHRAQEGAGGDGVGVRSADAAGALGRNFAGAVGTQSAAGSRQAEAAFFLLGSHTAVGGLQRKGLKKLLHHRVHFGTKGVFIVSHIVHPFKTGRAEGGDLVVLPTAKISGMAPEGPYAVKKAQSAIFYSPHRYAAERRLKKARGIGILESNNRVERRWDHAERRGGGRLPSGGENH